MRPIAVPDGGSISFIDGSAPLGFATPEGPSTHLSKYAISASP
ncbi:MAG: hypothetical protein WDN46_10585 [Methylocella sp.]